MSLKRTISRIGLHSPKLDGSKKSVHISTIGSKQNRNDLCACGSEKKFKKCCGGVK